MLSLARLYGRQGLKIAPPRPGSTYGWAVWPHPQKWVFGIVFEKNDTFVFEQKTNDTDNTTAKTDTHRVHPAHNWSPPNRHPTNRHPTRPQRPPNPQTPKTPKPIDGPKRAKKGVYPLKKWVFRLLPA